MRAILFSLILAVFLPAFLVAQAPTEEIPITILSFEWKNDKRDLPQEKTAPVVPVRQVIPENKNFRRTAREQQPPGGQDPNDVTTDGRSAALERTNQEAQSRKREPIIGYSYSARIQNVGKTMIEIVFLEFKFTELANREKVVRRQFVCVANLKPGGRTELKVFSTAGPSDVVNAETVAMGGDRLFEEKAIVNRTEDANGMIVQRRDWKFAEVREGLSRAISTPWGKESCRPI